MTPVEYLHLPARSELPVWEQATPYKAVVLIEQTVPPEWRDAVSDWLVNSGCFYMMAWVHKCSEWDDSVDYASLDRKNFEITSDDELVMTTWHENEAIEEVFWFAEFSALHPTIPLDRTLIIDIVADARREDILGRFEKAIQN